MTPKEVIEKIQRLLMGEQVAPVAPVEEPKPVEMAEVKTADGKVLKVDTMAVGGNVVLGDAPAPDGEYLLEDGHKLVVVGGLITEIEMKQEPAVEMPEEMKAKFTAQEQHIAILNGQVDDLKKTMSNYNEAVKLMFEHLQNSSVQKPTEKVSKRALTEFEMFWNEYKKN